MGSDSKGGAMTILLKNDIALAKQSVTDWSLFADDMCTLFKAGLDMEMNNGAAIFMKLRVKASFYRMDTRKYGYYYYKRGEQIQRGFTIFGNYSWQFTECST